MYVKGEWRGAQTDVKPLSRYIIESESISGVSPSPKSNGLMMCVCVCVCQLRTTCSASLRDSESTGSRPDDLSTAIVWRPKHYIATPHVRLKKKNRSFPVDARQKAFNSIKAFAGRIVRITASRSSCCHWTWYGYVVLYCRPATQLCYKEITQRMLVWSYAAITRLHKWTLTIRCLTAWSTSSYASPDERSMVWLKKNQNETLHANITRHTARTQWTTTTTMFIANVQSRK